MTANLDATTTANLDATTTATLDAFEEPRYTRQQCDALFAAVLVHDDPYPDARLPAAIHLDYRQEQLTQCYTICRQLWQDGVDRQALHGIIDKICRNRSLGAQDQLAFKHQRARFKHLRFAFAAFSAQHRYPRAFHYLVALMGHLQDAIKNGQLGVSKRAAVVLRFCLGKVCYAWVSRSIDQFQPSSPESFRDYVHDQIRFIRVKLSQQEITAKEFHQMRIVISRQVALYDNLKILYPSPYHRCISQYLSTLNGMMGRLHDELVTRKFNKTQDYYSDTFAMPVQIRQRLTALTARYPQTAIG